MGQKAEITVISIDDLRVGATCHEPLEDENGLLLLGAGTRITSELIQGLRDRGIDRLEVRDESVASSIRNPSPTPHVRHPYRPANLTPHGQPSQWVKGIPLKACLVNRHADPICEHRRRQLESTLSVSRDMFEKIRLDLTQQKLQSVEAINQLTGAYASALVDDYDQTLGHVVGGEETRSLTDRGVRLSVLGMSVATEMDFDGPAILEVGQVGLLHDVGLYTMDPSLSVMGRGPLNDDEIWEYRKHPIISANCLRDAGVSHSVILAVEQVHEQFDGRGYPFGLEGKRCHIYARVLNVCDAYLRLTAGTSFRRPLVPHDALSFILHQARFGAFDPKVIRALLKSESLFPMGSRVKLENGDQADVIRRPLQGYATPVLRDDHGSRIESCPDAGDHHIVAPACDTIQGQRRLSQTAMRQIRWNPADELFLDDE